MGLLLAVALYGFLYSCAGGGGSAKMRKFDVPPGVDSTVARQADSVKIFLFAEPKTEKEINKLKEKARERFQRSDSLWARIAERTAISQLDSNEAQKHVGKGKEALKEIASHNDKGQAKRLDPETNKKIARLLDEAIAAFEKAILLNPYDLDAKSWLARVYRVKADRLQNEKDYENAARVLEDFVKIDKSQHDAYYRLGQNYFRIRAWKAAYDSFIEAENVLKQTAFVKVENPGATMRELEDAPVDTSDLFFYRYYQGVTQARLYHAEKSLAILATAETLASNAEQAKSVTDFIDWINWDDGNIRASEIRDSLVVLQNREQFSGAASGFLRLVKFLKTQRAQDEIEWRASVIEYEKLNKKDNAVERLQKLAARSGKAGNGAVADSSYQKYFEHYATMCYNLGAENGAARKWQTAYSYFLQATKIPWKGRAKSHIEIAKIVQNKPDMVIEHALEAQKDESSLSFEERKQLYQLLSLAYLKKGKSEEARKTRKQWLELQKENHRNASSQI